MLNWNETGMRTEDAEGGSEWGRARRCKERYKCRMSTFENDILVPGGEGVHYDVVGPSNQCTGAVGPHSPISHAGVTILQHVNTVRHLVGLGWSLVTSNPWFLLLLVGVTIARATFKPLYTQDSNLCASRLQVTSTISTPLTTHPRGPPPLGQGVLHSH